MAVQVEQNPGDQNIDDTDKETVSVNDNVEDNYYNEIEKRFSKLTTPLPELPEMLKNFLRQTEPGVSLEFFLRSVADFDLITAEESFYMAAMFLCFNFYFVLQCIVTSVCYLLDEPKAYISEYEEDAFYLRHVSFFVAAIILNNDIVGRAFKDQVFFDGIYLLNLYIMNYFAWVDLVSFFRFDFPTTSVMIPVWLTFAIGLLSDRLQHNYERTYYLWKVFEISFWIVVIYAVVGSFLTNESLLLHWRWWFLETSFWFVNTFLFIQVVIQRFRLAKNFLLHEVFAYVIVGSYFAKITKIIYHLSSSVIITSLYMICLEFCTFALCLLTTDVFVFTGPADDFWK